MPTTYPEWLRERFYPHFDSEFTKAAAKEKVLKWVQDPEWVANRAFQPFIRKERISWKRKRVLKEDEVKKTTKSKRKRRPICFASHLDAHIYAYYASLLKEPYEAAVASLGINDNVIAYRAASPGYCNIHYARDVFAYIQKSSPCVALLFDIEKFFDTLDHNQLKHYLLKVLDPSETLQKLPQDYYAIFRSLTKFSFIKENRLKKKFKSFFTKPFQKRSGKRICTPEQLRDLKKEHLKTNKQSFGIPQGSSLSAVLSNIYMLSFDEEMKKLCDAKGALYRRYSDDIMVVCNVEIWDDVEKEVLKLIADQHLTSHEGKTEKLLFSHDNNSVISCIDLKSGEPHKVQYLGFTFDGSQVAIRMASIGRFIGKLNRSAIGSAIDCKVMPSVAYLRRRLFEGFSHKSREKTNFSTYLKRAESLMKKAGLKTTPISNLRKKNLSIIDKAARKARKKAVYDFYFYPRIEPHFSKGFGVWPQPTSLNQEVK